MIDWRACPLSPTLLQRYRYRAGHQSCPSMAGGHLMRRKGAGMEFHEYTPFVPGDDIRRVDWAASARTGEEDAWLVRRFAAEEQTTLLISVDLRPTMSLPQNMPKALIALWLAEALAVAGLQGGDRVVLHRLFGEDRRGPVELKTPDRRRLHAGLRRLNEYRGATRFNMLSLPAFLPPASIWVLISDLYFPRDGQMKHLAQTMCSAQAGLRWLIVVELDTWRHERSLLGKGDLRLEGPEGQNLNNDGPERLFAIDEQQLDQVEARIHGHKQQFHQTTAHAGRDFTNWVWPNDANDPENFFRDQFLGDKLLHRIFMREH